MEKITEINRALEDVLKQITQKKSEIGILKQNEFVIMYLDSLHELDKLNLKQQKLKIERMKNCNHYFVIHEVDDGWDGHRYNYSNLATCIHCGLTNRFNKRQMNWLGFPYDEMIPLIQNGAMSNQEQYHGYCDSKDINEIKGLYDYFRSNNRDMDDEQIEKQIAKVKKPKLKTSCII